MIVISKTNCLRPLNGNQSPGRPQDRDRKGNNRPVARNQNELQLGLLKEAGLLRPEILESLTKTKAKGKLAELTQKEFEYLDELEER
ncbi:MAG TPA: hypothetical protein VNA15_10700 [Candidatus Angelobacter sp.]|nr:hypothetical protein [Candidatus Angelobacter sp.]